MKKNKETSNINKTDCKYCKPVSGFYLGMTCPKCNKPFRMIKFTKK